MITPTSPLSQYHMKEKKPDNDDNNRSTYLRRMLPNILINAVVPFVINILAKSYTSPINALLLASAVPALFTLGSFLVKKRVDVIGILVVASLLLTAVFALLFRSPRLLLIQTSTIMGLFGIVLLISLLFPRPALFYLARAVRAQNDEQHFARFNAGWAWPQIRFFYRKLTAIWGCVAIVHLLVQAVLAFTLPISVMLVLGPVLSFIIITPVAHWSRRAARKYKPFFDLVRQQQEAHL